MSETEELRKERERIEQEKEELLAKQKRFVPRFESEREPSMPPLPKPVPLKSAMHRLGPKIKIGEDPRPSTSRHDPRPRGDGDRGVPSRRAGVMPEQYRSRTHNFFVNCLTFIILFFDFQARFRRQVGRGERPVHGQGDGLGAEGGRRRWWRQGQVPVSLGVSLWIRVDHAFLLFE